MPEIFQKSNNRRLSTTGKELVFKMRDGFSYTRPSESQDYLIDPDFVTQNDGYFTTYRIHPSSKRSGIKVFRGWATVAIVKIGQRVGEENLLTKYFQQNRFTHLPSDFVTVVIDVHNFGNLLACLTPQLQAKLLTDLHVVLGQGDNCSKELLRDDCFVRAGLRNRTMEFYGERIASLQRVVDSVTWRELLADQGILSEAVGKIAAAPVEAPAPQTVAAPQPVAAPTPAPAPVEAAPAVAQPKRKERIFISYKRVDKDKVFPIKNYIETHTGLHCWIDLDGIESDDQFVEVIIKAINNCDVVLFMYSHQHTLIQYVNVDWTIKELSYAQRKNKRIVFINIDGTPLSDWFDFHFGERQQIDGLSEEALDKLGIDLLNWLEPKAE